MEEEWKDDCLEQRVRGSHEAGQVHQPLGQSERAAIFSGGEKNAHPLYQHEPLQGDRHFRDAGHGHGRLETVPRRRVRQRCRVPQLVRAADSQPGPVSRQLPRQDSRRTHVRLGTLEPVPVPSHGRQAEKVFVSGALPPRQLCDDGSEKVDVRGQLGVAKVQQAHLHSGSRHLHVDPPLWVSLFPRVQPHARRRASSQVPARQSRGRGQAGVPDQVCRQLGLHLSEKGRRQSQAVPLQADGHVADVGAGAHESVRGGSAV